MMMNNSNNCARVIAFGVLLLASLLTVQLRAELPPVPADHHRVAQVLDDFSVPVRDPATAAFQYYTRLNSSRNVIGSPSALAWAPSGLLVLSPPPAEYSGIALSFIGDLDKAADPRTLDFSAPWTSILKSEFQPAVVGWRVRYKGTAPPGHPGLKIEPSGSTAEYLPPADDWTVWEDGFEEVSSQVKQFNLVVDGGAEFQVDRVDLLVDLPDRSALETAGLTSFAQLLRCWDPVTGSVQDHAQFKLGDFEAVPGVGFVAFASAVYTELGFADREKATKLVAKSVAAAQAIRKWKGWLPHWTTDGEWLPAKTLGDGKTYAATEISTVDTALTLWPLLLATTVLGMESERTEVEGMILDLDFDAVLDERQERISHGFSSADPPVPLEQYWDVFGSESLLVELLYYYAHPDAPLLRYERQPPVFRGRAFIQDMASLFFPQAGGVDGVGPDRFGVDWYQARSTLHEAQLALARGGLYGFSPVEMVDAEGNTGYCELGSGDGKVDGAAVTSCVGFSIPDAIWIAPHAIALHSTLDTAAASAQVEALFATELMPPLAGPAEAAALTSAGTVARYHSVQTALNAFFNAAGYGAALLKNRGGRDPVYAVSQSNPRLREALTRLWPAGSDADGGAAGTSDAGESGAGAAGANGAGASGVNAGDGGAGDGGNGLKAEGGASANTGGAGGDRTTLGSDGLPGKGSRGCACRLQSNTERPTISWLAVTAVLVVLRRRSRRRAPGVEEDDQLDFSTL